MLSDHFVRFIYILLDRLRPLCGGVHFAVFVIEIPVWWEYDVYHSIVIVMLLFGFGG